MVLRPLNTVSASGVHEDIGLMTADCRMPEQPLTGARERLLAMDNE